MVSKLREENKGLSDRVMEADRKVIQLQELLSESKENQLKCLTVETVVRDTVYCTDINSNHNEFFMILAYKA